MFEEQKQEMVSFITERIQLKEEIERLKEKCRKAEDDARHSKK
jgi:hypothetical protein